SIAGFLDFNPEIETAAGLSGTTAVFLFR
ncbi:MAG: hypothetical protein QOJ41_2317, partial [Acidobacteriaceae bacterium]|nr:hypothetical protein [Acidobacteriaceae bacterium]